MKSATAVNYRKSMYYIFEGSCFQNSKLIVWSGACLAILLYEETKKIEDANFFFMFGFDIFHLEGLVIEGCLQKWSVEQ